MEGGVGGDILFGVVSSLVFLVLGLREGRWERMLFMLVVADGDIYRYI